ncbi:VTT domain-containing protein [Ruminococcus sp.]|uniref:TVP38/TMEM64 family protein n=1 Tax=Ruminococcus sp. TaxID=41978 RepID=UPI0025E88DFB|nr:VTT domain-containing protein [Ruminococcus sp.]
MNRFVRKYGRFVPFLLTIVIIICCIFFLKEHDFSDILSYCPDNLWLAALVFLGFYALKSLSVVFPLTALFVSIGAIYPFGVAVVLNIAGLAVCFTIPYLVGRISGGDLIRVVERRYPKVQKMVNYGHDNNLFASYISRAVVVVPGDVVSMIHGALRMPYRPYLLGSLLGVMPEMLVQTYIGAQLKHLTVKSVIVMVALIVATLAFSLLLNKKGQQERQGA